MVREITKREFETRTNQRLGSHFLVHLFSFYEIDLDKKPIRGPHFASRAADLHPKPKTPSAP